MEKNKVGNVFHYLDNFITLGPPDTPTCLDGIVRTYKITGTPLELSKSEGPTTTLTFLRMELDTVKLEIRLPIDKLACLKMVLKRWETKRAGKKRDLLSLIGYLQHAAKAVRQGRSFLRRLIKASTVVDNLDGFLRLNVVAYSDIKWWSVFASQWNGTSMLVRFSKSHPDFTVTSDASGNWGCGAYEQEQWFQLQWPTAMEDIGEGDDSYRDCSSNVGRTMVGKINSLPIRQLGRRSATEFGFQQKRNPDAPDDMSLFHNGKI